MEKPPSLEQLTVKRKQDDVEIVHDGEVDPLAAYNADGGSKTAERKVVFSQELGLAVEELQDGFTIEKLWDIHPPQLQQSNN